MQCRGHESWHPDPAFYYQAGGGPMMDMGPYYITALINLLGEAAAVTGIAQQGFAERIITSQPLFGSAVKAEVSTHINGIIQFASGASATITTSFDVYPKNPIRFEIYGTEGTLAVPDPNCFGGPVLLYRPQDGEFREIPLMFAYKDNSRGLGVADMAKSIETRRPARTCCQQLYHVLEILTAFEKSSQTKRTVTLTTHYNRSAPMLESVCNGILR